MSIASTQITVASQLILAGQLEDPMVKEHPNRMVGRIKNEVIDRTVAVSWNSPPATVEFRPRTHRPVILTGCEEDAIRSERAYRGKCGGATTNSQDPWISNGRPYRDNNPLDSITTSAPST